MSYIRLAQISDAPELKILNDLFNGEDNAFAQSLYYSCGYADTSEILLDRYIERGVAR